MSDRDPGVWFARPPVGVVALFCFPAAGHGTRMFRTWERAFPPTVAPLPLRLPARERRIADPLPDTLTGLAAEVGAAVAEFATGRQTPYAFAGHSLGAWLMYETAKWLRTAGVRMPCHLFASGQLPPDRPRAGVRLHELSDESLLADLRQRGLVPAEVVTDPDLRELVLPAIRDDFRLLETYQWTPGERLHVPLTAARGRGDDGLGGDDLSGWREHTTAAATVVAFDGTHFFCTGQSVREFTGLVTATLEPFLAE